MQTCERMPMNASSKVSAQANLHTIANAAYIFHDTTHTVTHLTRSLCTCMSHAYVDISKSITLRDTLAPKALGDIFFRLLRMKVPQETLGERHVDAPTTAPSFEKGTKAHTGKGSKLFKDL